MSQFTTSRRFDLFFVLVLVGGLVYATYQRSAILDWFYFRTYHPQVAIEQLATDAGLNGYGRRLFYRGDPQLVSRAEIQQACGADIVGCIDEHNRIYLLKEDKPQDHYEVTVTAAHEMLHLAYRRLAAGDRQRVNNLVETAAGQVGSALQQELASTHDTTEQVDEEHSLLGSEYGGLPLPLEEYYQDYFSNRAASVKAYQLSNH